MRVKRSELIVKPNKLFEPTLRSIVALRGHALWSAAQQKRYALMNREIDYAN